MYGDINSKAVRVGTFVQDSPKEYRRTYETASWWTIIEVPAGEYEITTNGYWYWIRLPGTIVDEYFVNSLFGHTSVAEKRCIGQAATYIVLGYEYNLARLAATDPKVYQLDEGWTIKAEQRHDPHSHNNSPYTMFKLVPPTNPQPAPTSSNNLNQRR